MRPYLRGTVGMALDPWPDTGGSQYFITHSPQPHLDAVTVLDDAGLGVLLGGAGQAREQGGDLVIVSTRGLPLASDANG